MSLDIRTVLLMFLIASTLIAIAMALGVRGTRAPGLLKWNLGQALYVGGWVLVVARDFLHPVVGFSIANGLLLQAICLQVSALREYGGRKTGWQLWLAGPALSLAIVPLWDRYPVMNLLTSTSYAVALGALGVLSLRLGKQAGPVRWLSAASVVAGAGLLLARAADIALSGQAGGMFTNQALHAAAFIALFVTNLATSFAFLLMHREQAEQELRHLAMHDPLTDVYNRRAFMRLAEREVARARRDGSPYAVLMLDLDHFKQVNDRHGHQAGDAVLAEFAARVAGCLRAGDLLGRYGGEEFCIVLPGAKHAEALAAGERIRAAVAEKPLGGLESVVTVSVGAASCADASAALEAAIERADAALYAAKGTGRNRVIGLELQSARGEGRAAEARLATVVGTQAPLVDHRAGRAAALRRAPPLGMSLAPRE